MGVNPLWQEDFFLTIQAISQQIEAPEVNPYYIIDLKTGTFIHLVPISNNFCPEQLIALQEGYLALNRQLVHLWEDVWLARRAQVLSRIQSFLKQNKTLHGRKTKLIDLNSQTAKQFLDAYHLQGFVRCKTYVGLTQGDELIAVAGFSGARAMKSKGATYKSAELVRFASKTGFTISGGLSKLLKQFLKNNPVNDLMTYADRDWSIGKGHDKLGFEMKEQTEPLFLYVNLQTNARSFPHRLPKGTQQEFERQNMLNLDDFLAENGFVKVFNTGNLKYLLYT